MNKHQKDRWEKAQCGEEEEKEGGGQQSRTEQTDCKVHAGRFTSFMK
jgi:hypothetical protein